MKVVSLHHYFLDSIVACVYTGEWYIGNIIERSDEYQDIHVSFMKKSGDLLNWPHRKDSCWIPFTSVLCIVSAPEPQSHGARFYRLQAADMEKVLDRFSHFT